MSTILSSCSTTKTITGIIEGENLKIDLKEFEEEKKNKIEYRKYLVVSHESLQFPICIYRFKESNFSALYLKCTHQGAELQVFGDQISCPAHGSEFNNMGIVQNGPASTNLRTFPIQINNGQLLISLK